MIWLWLALTMGAAALVLAAFYGRQVNAASPGNALMRQLMADIREGAMTFLKREYTAVAVFVVILAALILIFLDWGRPWGAVAYVFGAALSALAGYIGMRTATAANARTAEAARTGGVAKALPLAFRGGAVMGFTVAGLGLLGLSLGYLFFVEILEDENAFQIITAIGLGASSIALFSRVGGGIFTKAADIGADLVGKIEVGIPEDDPRNPAVIADLVGDNVGDVAGMGADLFESYVGSMIAPLAFAAFAFKDLEFQDEAFFYPLMIATLGMAASIIGSFFVRPGSGSLAGALHRGTWVSMGITVLGVVIFTPIMFDGVGGVDNSWGLVIAVASGLAIGGLIGQISEWFTSDRYRIVKEVARQAQTGPATVVLSGISEGMRSAAFSVIVAAMGMAGAYWGGDLAFDHPQAGVYGIAIAAVGVLSTLGITVSVDAYGPIADNAGGIAEMAHLPPEVREATDALDALGNTTAAVAKGFAIASAAVTALALFFTFRQAVLDAGGDLVTLDILDIHVTIGLFLGGMFPFLFAALTIQAVGRAANRMIEEVRRQFREIPGLLEGKEGVRPDSARAVDISTSAALREMLIPGSLAIALPLIVGFISVRALGGLLAGSLITGFLLAIFMSNAGGAWDNAKKFIEAGAYGGKGSDAHKATIVGDTVGDPFKDTSGPSMNILLKLMAIVAVVFGPLFL